MEVSYTHANPRAGQESYYIKFYEEATEQTMCVLVDSGRSVSVKDDLRDDEYLAGVLLTHAHGDHYATLASNIVDGASVYTSPDTARVLEKILEETVKHDDIGDSGRVTDSLTPITDWTTLFGTVEVKPIPAGHCPGAVGFVIRFKDAGDTHHILASGDFTFSSVAGNPAMPKSLPFQIDAMFMNASVTGIEEPPFTETIEESLETILERTVAGGDTLVTASGLAGVHYAYLLGHIADTTDRRYTVALVGHLAKLYEDLEYDVPHVETICEFSDPLSVMHSADICIAGPAVPANNTSEKLFDVIRDNPGSALVQILGGSGYDPVDSASCGIYTYEYKAHPTQSELDEFVENLVPRELIIEHGRTTLYGDRYNHTITWANRDYDEYVLYEDGFWKSPHWINPDADESIRSNNHRKAKERFDPIDRAASELPTIDRHDSPDLATEGISRETVAPTTTTPEINAEVEDTAADEATVTDGGAATTSTTDPTPGLGQITDRLDRIESLVDGPETTARVIDAGDGDILLKLDADDIDGVEHGDIARVMFPDLNAESEGEDVSEE